MARIDTKGVKMGYEIHGKGSPLLFISGLGYGRWLWEKLVPLLEKNFQLLLVDNRGVGETEASEYPFTIRDMAKDILHFMDALDLQRVNLVGASLGGFIAQETVLMAPERVQRLILLCTTAGGEKSTFASPETMETLQAAGEISDPMARAKALIEPAVSTGFFQDKEAVQTLLRKYLCQNADPKTVMIQQAAGQEFWQKEHRVDFLPKVPHPALVLAGSEDRIVPPENAQQLTELLPAAKKVLVPSAGHLLMWENAGAVANAIIDFMGEDK